jgi:hypothetical protein
LRGSVCPCLSLAFFAGCWCVGKDARRGWDGSCRDVTEGHTADAGWGQHSVQPRWSGPTARRRHKSGSNFRRAGLGKPNYSTHHLVIGSRSRVTRLGSGSCSSDAPVHTDKSSPIHKPLHSSDPPERSSTHTSPSRASLSLSSAWQSGNRQHAAQALGAVQFQVLPRDAGEISHLPSFLATVPVPVLSHAGLTL